jgi:cytidylate kinase
MPVVTISSQFGAGAPDVGRRVADRLRLQYVDQAILVDAARELGVSVKSVEEHDERTDSFRERMVHFLQRALER